MEHSYWLRRSRAAGAMARRAETAEARLAHLELSGRYSIKAAATARTRGCAPAVLEPEHGGAVYYEQLEGGARWLAAKAGGAAERDQHLGMANRYARLRLEAPRPGRR